MNKETIIAHLLEMQEDTLNDLQNRIKDLYSSANLDEEETKDPEDYSHQTEENELAHRLKFQLTQEESDYYHFKTINKSAKTSAVPGSLVETDQYLFVVGISTTPFDVKDKHVIGISERAPIYHKMKGLTVGDSFSVGKVKYNIRSIQ